MTPKSLFVLNMVQLPFSLLGAMCIVACFYVQHEGLNHGGVAPPPAVQAAPQTPVAPTATQAPPSAPVPPPPPPAPEPPPEPSSPADPAGRPVSKRCFQIIQVLVPGRALAINPIRAVILNAPITLRSTPTMTMLRGNIPGDYMGDGQTYLLVGVPKTLVDDDGWVGWVFQGDNYSYETVSGGSRTVRTLIVSTSQEPEAR